MTDVGRPVYVRYGDEIKVYIYWLMQDRHFSSHYECNLIKIFNILLWWQISSIAFQNCTSQCGDIFPAAKEDDPHMLNKEEGCKY